MYRKFRQYIPVLIVLLFLIPVLGVLLLLSGDRTFTVWTVLITTALISLTTFLFGLMLFLLGAEWERNNNNRGRDLELTLVSISDSPFTESYEYQEQ